MLKEKKGEQEHDHSESNFYIIENIISLINYNMRIFRINTKAIAVFGNAIDLLARYVFKKFKFLFFDSNFYFYRNSILWYFELLNKEYKYYRLLLKLYYLR